MKITTIICICFVFSAKADINKIPQNDLKNIKFFFEFLIHDHDFAYTIFGSKPMSLADYGLKVPDGLAMHRRLRSWYILMRAKARLESWYLYRKEFVLKDFIFLDEENDWTNCLILILINKKNMLCVLHENASIFKEELGMDFTPESFLEKLEKREMTLAKAISKSQKLLGIMLGYGVRNATLFQERYNVMKAICKRKKSNLPEDETLTKKLVGFEAQCKCFSELEENAVIHPLYFFADTAHPETIELKKRYENDRRKIEELRQKSDFMNKVLKRLTE
jgi:hypothetical protein